MGYDLPSVVVTSAYTKQVSSTTNYTTVIPGTLPLLLTVPHGGQLMPSSIPNRTEGQLIADAFTIDLAHLIADQIEAHYRARPAMLILNVARRKVDVNRDIKEGTTSAAGQAVWHEYHKSLKGLVHKIKADHQGEGLVLDIHGQAHKEAMVELGYLVHKSQLADSGASDRSLVMNSSLSRLAHRLASNSSTSPRVASLLRGNASFGAAMMHHTDEKVQTVPSPAHKAPAASALYFDGGYTTATYSRAIDVIQIESPQVLRFDAENRRTLASAIVQAAVYMLDSYYEQKVALTARL
ncbi:hypothetical protein BC940DRAFT_332966 [Gongronella butleri]|nr:hypothetical protein BC940DRAFT_332966 [Gongronella butleri]